jgi:cell division protein FtsN
LSKNDEGEFELVLGNRQLVSVFLIVVILLGAFFSMGYLVGRSSTSGAVSAESKPIVVEGAAKTASSAAPGSDSVPTPKLILSPDAPKPVETPAVETEKPSPLRSDAETKAARKEEDKREAAAKHEEVGKLAKKEIAKKEELKKLEEAKKEASHKPGPAPTSDEPRGGTFLQVVATSRPDAEIVAESLQKKGFRTTIAPGPSSAVFRVLVGPVGDASDLSETRVRLESAGFKPYVRKY